MGKKVIAGIITFLVLIIISYGFVPQVLSNKVVNQGDIRGFRGMSREADLWNAHHPDDKTAWTNSMFGGMPTIMITGNPTGDYSLIPYKLLQLGKRPATYFLISLIGGLLLMLSLGISLIPGAIGAIAITFCSYNMQIIQVGHNTKMLALAFLPWVLAACIFTYKSALIELHKNKTKDRLFEWLPKTFLGATLFAFATSFELKANHIQISYYLAIIMAVYVISLFIYLTIKDKKKISRFIIASLLLLIIGSVGIATNANHLIPSYEYSHHTMRGGSDLNPNKDGKKKNGLDLKYATAWSYGWEELPNLLIPNYNGGSSTGELSMNSNTINLLKRAGQPNLKEVSKSMPLYWGPQPFTAGPMYMGAISIFLFILGLFLYKEKEKWWLIITSIIAIFLGVGSHFMPFTELWYNYAPFYNKFRTVSMALVILQFTIPILGILVLDKILKGEYTASEFKKYSIISLIITGGFCLAAILFPSIAGSFTGSSDGNQPKILVEALQADRIKLLQADALKSLFVILITFVLLWFSYKNRPNQKEVWYKNRKLLISSFVIGIILFFNMAIMGKRYLNGDNFISAIRFNQPVPESPADKIILEDKSPDYRVLNLTANIFNDSQTSFYHKSIGGYSPVKMQRYQDLIDYHLEKEIQSLIKLLNTSGLQGFEQGDYKTPVLNMLNDKYIIVNENMPPLVNKKAYGNCWFVDTCRFATSPIEEINLLDKVNLKSVAIVGKDFEKYGRNIKYSASPNDSIYLSSYSPNKLIYKYKAKTARTAVFSEIYYPKGWKAIIDKTNNIDIFRTNWTLRAINLPAGEHTLTMTFEPKSYLYGTNISRASSILLYILLILSFGGIYMNKKEN